MPRAKEGRSCEIAAEMKGVIVGIGDSRPLGEYNAVFNSSTNYVSTVTTEKSYTSFKWILNDYSLLEDYCVDDLCSPKFLITNTDKQCQLIFTKQKEMMYLFLKVPRDIKYEILEICFSIIDKNDKKIIKSRLLVNPPGKGEKSHVYYKVALIAANEIFFNEKCLVNNTLILLCEIVLVDKVNISKTDVHSSNVVHSDKSTCQQFGEYYSDKAFCDIDLFVSEKQFRAHKLILATASPVFKAMFQAGMLETEKNSVHITDIDADVFEKFLKYLYVGKVENLDKVAIDLLIVAEKYQVSGLMDLCENFAISSVDVSNAIERLLVAHEHSFKKLKDAALQFVRTNIQNLTKGNNFKELCVYSDLLAEVLSKSD